MTTYTLYHNPRCTKSRQTLALMQAHGIEPTIRLYLKKPPTHSELKDCLNALAIQPRQLLRSKEALFKTLGLADPALTDEALIQAMVENPTLIERPIVIQHTEQKPRAVLGRPPENFLQLIKE